jgi:TIR domain-containing protein
VTDIFFSYSSADRERVRPIRDALAAQGFEVFWDQEVPTGLDWDSWIRQHLAKCKCAMAFWSAASVASDNVRHEAVVAKQQGKLISVLLESLTAQQFPMGLYAQQAANLADWNGDPNHNEWRKFRREYEAKLIPTWVRHQLDELEAELVGERARREGVERRDKTLQAQIAKEAQAHQDLKRELDKALDDTTALRATIENLSTARSEAETAARELQRERDDALGHSQALKTTSEELGRIRSESEANIVELSRNLDEKTAQLSALTKSSARQIGLARSAMRAALFARGSTMQFVSIAAAVATLSFWTYHLVGSASPPTASEQGSVEQASVLPVAVVEEARRKVEEAEQFRKEAERQANLAADADAKRQAAEAEQQRLKDEVQRQAKAAAEAETRLQGAQAEQLRQAKATTDAETRLQAAQAEQQRQTRAATDADGRRRAAEAEQQRLKDEVQRLTKAAADADTKRRAAEDEQQRLAAKIEEERKKVALLMSSPAAPSADAKSAGPSPAAPAAQSPQPSRFDEKKNMEASGILIGYSFETSVGGCEQRCTRNVNCTVFSFKKTKHPTEPGNYCFTYSRATDINPNVAYDSGIRK